jgi:probable addiction module antidote protein
MPLKTTPYDSADYLNTEEEIAEYLNVCLEDGNPALIAKAIGTVARARERGMSQLAKDTKLGRESLYKSLSGEGNPSFATIVKVLNALHIKLTVSV